MGMLIDVDYPLAAASQSASSLAQEIERQQEECDCPPKPNFVFEDSQGGGGCDCVGSGAPKSGKRATRHSLLMLDGIVELIKKDPSLERELRQVGKRGSSQLSSLASRLAKCGRRWLGSVR